MQNDFSGTSLLDLGQLWAYFAEYCKKSLLVPVLSFQLTGHSVPALELLKRKQTRRLVSEPRLYVA